VKGKKKKNVREGQWGPGSFQTPRKTRKAQCPVKKRERNGHEGAVGKDLEIGRAFNQVKTPKGKNLNRLVKKIREGSGKKKRTSEKRWGSGSCTRSRGKKGTMGSLSVLAKRKKEKTRPGGEKGRKTCHNCHAALERKGSNWKEGVRRKNSA